MNSSMGIMTFMVSKKSAIVEMLLLNQSLFIGMDKVRFNHILVGVVMV